MPLDRAAETYLRHVAIERGLSQHTLSAYRRDLAVFTSWLADAPVVESDGADRAGGSSALLDVARLARADFSGFVTHLATRPEGPLAPRSIARMLSSVRSFTAFAAGEGWLPLDPGTAVRPPKAPMRLPKAIPVEDMERLLGAVSVDADDPVQLRDKALLELLYATGARISEAVGLSVDDVTTLSDADGELSVVKVTGKGNKQRIVPLGSFARAAIDAYLVRARPVFAARGPSTPALFLGARGARLSRQSAWLVIQAAAAAADLEAHVSPHTFRHSFATHLLEGGADVRVVQELLGHASVATTQIYTMVTADMLRDVYQTAHPRARR
ncbi:site-specific tyrosine recombinase XerD [Curtobacterium flaccumfaciens]|uniref:site-specific tyrosine recombinase XerD n=1 Tax=Curtobacterium flaccumfaciens TaxID=2035 RepID=UPI001BDF7125|nr:site-specific tyrosine recombinase XerD [Curtobacterium flaccumfaciens]MBT1607434.1 site-specific tyrosine recombinase XerD [Curtobacterium flaccumfaciens pv. betae]MBT1657184.1 site-specific tyrosine recombinase XerD [Curtobacterium flaccumfaciens pv. betae]MCS0472068.1 site-specific tyrosine recombinase XerD [Curtobacterium flaccumfaciens pv. betae]MCS0476018.1 site-specific tyrosine recombinase XerD [Curtobacterium flaccumfaciens pv. betae]MCS0478481.1 site-specific tyrosine recombinase 